MSKGALSDTGGVDLFQFLEMLDLQDRPGPQHVTLVEDSEAITDLADKIEIMLDNQDSAFCFDCLEQSAGEAPLGWAHSPCRFVKEEQSRFASKRRGDLKPLLFPMAEFTCQVIGPASQAKPFECSHDILMHGVASD